MANVTVTFTITEFCLHTGISEEELNEIVGLGVVEPREIQETTWVFDDHAAIVVPVSYTHLTLPTNEFV